MFSPDRVNGIGLYIGLRNNTDTKLVTWDDGTALASDLPWKNEDDANNLNGRPFGRLHRLANLIATRGTQSKMALCGNHVNLPTEAHGASNPGQHAVGVSSSLSVTKVFSYLECVLLCGQDHRCRAAEYNSDLLTCMTLGPGSYSGLAGNINSQMFVRNGFS
ncbi:hypothetical protein ElyMa_003986000 [Elysia marginata]|uniref:Apple domain-containing protein n=1 Tax=Elysia marginata TaxID=1093978 RepID=A0AAV4FXN0_9GAST|nr:hypothetical protein ElyMa_003986000 [Elysia marginata]